MNYKQISKWSKYPKCLSATTPSSIARDYQCHNKAWLGRFHLKFKTYMHGGFKQFGITRWCQKRDLKLEGM